MNHAQTQMYSTGQYSLSYPIPYKIIGTMKFHEQTNPSICETLLNSMESNTHIVVYYGDVNTGKDWMNRRDSIGFVRKNTVTGTPMLSETKKGMGMPIMDQHIVKITTISGRILFRNYSYHE